MTRLCVGEGVRVCVLCVREIESNSERLYVFIARAAMTRLRVCACACVCV